MIDLLAHIKGIFDKYKKDEVTVYAAQASFFIVIAFFPFIMLLLTVIQLVPGVQKSDLLSLLVNIMPDMFDPLVVSIINDLYTKSPATIVSITSITALWSAARGMQGIESGLNRVFESPQTKGFILRRIICAGYTLLFIGSCLVSLLLLVFGSTIHGFLTRRFPWTLRSSVSPAVPDDHVAVVYRVYLPLHVCACPQAHFTEPGPRWRVRNLRMDHFFLPVFHLF